MIPHPPSFVNYFFQISGIFFFFTFCGNLVPVLGQKGGFSAPLAARYRSSIGCSCRPSSAALTVSGSWRKSATRELGFPAASSWPKGTKK